MTPINLGDWPPDLRIAFEGVLDYLCHRLLTVTLPEYHALEAVPHERTAQIAQRMRDAIRKRIEKGEWLEMDWVEQARPEEIRDPIRKFIIESKCLKGGWAPSDSTTPPQTSDNSLER